jgi:orotidine-5'-phosphate decarboxylase
MAISFSEKLKQSFAHNNSLLCVGLDPVIDRFPAVVEGASDGRVDAIFAFNKAVIDATSDLVCAYKPNSAFYEAYGAAGIEQLKKTCDYIRDVCPDLPIILDAKRGDIGNTNRGYAQFAYEYLGVDAITVHPYQGLGALSAFTEFEGRGIIVLCHTSNPESVEFQELVVQGEPLYMHIARSCAALYRNNPNISIVAGATYPDEIRHLRSIIGDMPMLVPGVGAQGGEAAEIVAAGMDADHAGLIINSSRGILYASRKDDYAQAARAAAQTVREDINSARPGL